MSTTATITIKVKDSDINKCRKCDVKKIRLRTIDDVRELYRPIAKNDEDLEERIKYIIKYDSLPTAEKLEKACKRIKLPKYLTIYHHWDAYPSGLGKELKKNYKTYEDVLNLCLAGGFSTILDGCMPYGGIKGDWGDTPPEKSDEVIPCRFHYQYLFEDGVWYYRENNGKFKKL